MCVCSITYFIYLNFSPHSGQNLLFEETSAPHFGHFPLTASFVPQSQQNFAPAGFAAPHSGQYFDSDAFDDYSLDEEEVFDKFCLIISPRAKPAPSCVPIPAVP